MTEDDEDYENEIKEDNKEMDDGKNEYEKKMKMIKKMGKTMKKITLKR